MSLTNEEALALLIERVETLERAVQNLQKIVAGKGSKQQLRQALTLRQQEITEMKERLDALEAQVALMNN